MELQQMRYAVAIAEERNFTRAAQRCFVVQSALSHQIKALEQELGAPLFVRSSRRVELTPAGEAFVAQARASLAAADRALTAVSEVTGQVRGSLSIGVIPTVTAVDVAAAAAKFHHDYPHVDLAVRSGSSDDFIRDIAAGTLDVAFLGLPDSTPPKGVASAELGHEKLYAVLPSAHPLAHRGELSLADLADETFIDFPAMSSGRRQSDQAFQTAGISRRVAFEAMSTDFMFELVAQGLGVCLQAPGTVKSRPDIRAVPLSDGPSRTEYLAWDPFNPSPATSAFLRQTMNSPKRP